MEKRPAVTFSCKV